MAIQTHYIQLKAIKNMNKKIYKILISLVFITLVIVGGYLTILSLSKKTTSINLENITQTGLVTETDASKQVARTEFLNLLLKGRISFPQFELAPLSDNSKIVVYLKEPSIESKQVFLGWLTENGYGHISQDLFVYKILP